MKLFLPRIGMIIIGFAVIAAGCIYATLIGTITGYFSIFCAVLFVISGIVALLSSFFRIRLFALIYSIVIIVSCAISALVNVIGMVLPSLASTRSGGKLFGIFYLDTNQVYFFVGALFLSICCVPCISLAICNLLTFGTATRKKPKQKKKKVRTDVGSYGFNFDNWDKVKAASNDLWDIKTNADQKYFGTKETEGNDEVNVEMENVEDNEDEEDINDDDNTTWGSSSSYEDDSDLSSTENESGTEEIPVDAQE